MTMTAKRKRRREHVAEGRNAAGALLCLVPGCRSAIRGWTGLDELTKLRAHIVRSHLAAINPNEALELRAKWESFSGERP